MVKYRNCKRGHDLENAVTWQGIRYCQECKKSRSAYEWYLIKCKRSGVTENVATWQEWALEKMGPAIKREIVRD